MVLIDGLHIPLTIPFTRDERLYLHKLESNVRRYSLSPAAGLVVLTPRSEGAALSDAETRDVLDATAAAAAPGKVLVAGIVRNSVTQALTVAALAEGAGFDAVMLAAPPRWPEMLRHTGSAAEVLNFFRTVADHAALPVMLSSDMATPWLGLSVETVAALSTHPNIVGIYDADLTVPRLRELQERTQGKQQQATVTTTFRPVTRRMLASQTGEGGLISAAALAGGEAGARAGTAPATKTRSKMLGFQVMSAGPASGVVDLLQAGVAGFMPGLAAPAPQSCHEVLAAFQDGDPALAAERAARLVRADQAIDRMGPAAALLGCDLNGYFGGLPRLPLAALRAEQRESVMGALRDLKN